MPRRVYIETYGCQMNEHDSERMLRLLERAGFEETKEPNQADLVLINTCSVREKPEHKVYSALGRFKRLKERKGTLIGVTGCVAQQEGERLLERVPYLDFVLGTHAIPLLPSIVQRVEALGGRVSETEFDAEGRYLEALLPEKGLDRVRSYVTIMQGCDQFCSYCIVPYVRGRERSRPSRDIVEEVRYLVSLGVKEVCLLGQNVNRYGVGMEGETDFPGLLEELNRIEGLERIRFTTSHPKDLSQRLIEAFSKLEKLCEHLHLPVQAGSNRVLEAMNRGYTREHYLERIDRLREACPSIAITADVIVGFPGEENGDFEETLDLLEKVRFDDLYSFKFSPRRGTRAAQLDRQVEEEVKERRLSILQALQREITLEKNKALEGALEEVLIEGASKQSSRDVTGRTRSNKIVNLPGKLDWVGRLMLVRITKAYPHSLRGEAVLNGEVSL